MNTDLLRLSERLAKAEGADCELDRLIRDTLKIRTGINRLAEPYTSSLDAALALVREKLPGWGVKLEWNMGYATTATVGHVGSDKLYDRPEGWAEGATPSLAILRALVDALLAQDPSHEGG